jgi:hypothetical protein
MPLCYLTLFTSSSDQPENRADVRVCIRITGVADIDHLYRRPADPAHIGVLHWGGVCINPRPSLMGLRECVHCHRSYIYYIVCFRIAISWTALFAPMRVHNYIIFVHQLPCQFALLVHMHFGSSAYAMCCLINLFLRERSSRRTRASLPYHFRTCSFATSARFIGITVIGIPCEVCSCLRALSTLILVGPL